MTISQDELKKIALKLSKIPSESDALLKNISDTLDYMELLNEVDTNGVIPTVSVIPESSILRSDDEERNISGKELLDCSHQKVVSGHIALPNIMK
ncbi:aspartyl/glutamyl-tRNA amidotransferase subunit C [Candidatus Gracilibacteria bacterium]|nr:aspartyl/glutamyl-tRNA amidotransferase subunit C [Candidatus Gracilibacteria bacterium]